MTDDHDDHDMFVTVQPTGERTNLHELAQNPLAVFDNIIPKIELVELGFSGCKCNQPMEPISRHRSVDLLGTWTPSGRYFIASSRIFSDSSCPALL